MDETVVIAAMDLCMAPQALVARWRDAIAGVAGTTPDHVLVNLSHTHSSGALGSTQPEFAFQADLLSAFEAMLGERLLAAATDAVAGLRPARIGAGAGQSTMGMQRRELGDDGYVFLGEVPDGPIDPEVGVVRIDDLEGSPIAILVAYGCHTVTVGPRATVASADFAAPLRDLVERTLGGTCLFLQGGGGDIMPRWGMGHELDNRDGKERVGWMVGGEAVAVAARIRTHVERGERVSIPSLLGPGQTMRPLVPVTSESCTAIGARSRSVPLDLIELPTEDRATALRAERQADLDRALESGSERADPDRAAFPRLGGRVGRRGPRGSVDRDDGGPGDPDQRHRLHRDRRRGVLVDDTRESGRPRRRPTRSRSATAMASLCYLPPRDAYPPGGWDVGDRYRIPDLVFQSYLLPVALDPGSEERVRDAVQALVEELWGEAHDTG